jgi:two-component system response regulator NreC
MEKIRVLLADDHAILRAGLKMFINAQEDMLCVGDAGNGRSALEIALQQKPDVILLDLNMPELNGLEALPQFRAQLPETRILILTMYTDETHFRKALAAGAAGYVLKKAADQELLSAIRAAMRGDVYIHPGMTKSLLNQMLPEGEAAALPSEEILSIREREVIHGVAQGHTNQEIADRLSLSIKTVETYRGRAMNKLNLKNRADLVRYALKQGWLQE